MDFERLCVNVGLPLFFVFFFFNLNLFNDVDNGYAFVVALTIQIISIPLSVLL